jgi:hypothetical protein
MAIDLVTPHKSEFGITGTITLWHIDEVTGLMTPTLRKTNQIQVWWGHIAARQFGFRRQPDRDDYFISGMYFEYENQTDPTATITTPNFDRTLGVNYYESLASSGTRDFLRVPMRLEPAISVTPGSVGADVLTTANLGNQLTFFAQTAGTQGVHGKTFSHITNSKIFSAALVAMPRFSDRTHDLVFARFNLDPAEQKSKEASSQIGLSWDLAFA